MPISKDQYTSVEVEEGTPGGDTYFVTINGVEQALCFRNLTSGKGGRCGNAAGKGTWHVGTGACSKHGGNAGRPVTHGRFATRAKQRLADKIDDYLEHDYDKLMSLDRELAAMKIMIQDFIDDFPDRDDDRYTIDLSRLTAMIQAAGSLVEKISRVEARSAITAAQVLYLRATIADLLMKYVPQEMREIAVLELAQRIGGTNMLGVGK